MQGEQDLCWPVEGSSKAFQGLSKAVWQSDSQNVAHWPGRLCNVVIVNTYDFHRALRDDGSTLSSMPAHIVAGFAAFHSAKKLLLVVGATFSIAVTWPY